MRDAVATMGTILDEDIQGRDAVHVAVIAVTAAHQLSAGDHVGKDGSLDEPIGIVDPFLTKTVQKGQRFWLFLYPRTITGLSHSWTHPAFDGDIARGDQDVAQSLAEQKMKSEQWLRKFTRENDSPSYEALVAGVTGDGIEGKYGDKVYVRYDTSHEYLHVSGEDASGHIPPEFWTHLEIVTGYKGSRPTYFSCSC